MQLWIIIKIDFQKYLIQFEYEQKLQGDSNLLSSVHKSNTLTTLSFNDIQPYRLIQTF